MASSCNSDSVWKCEGAFASWISLMWKRELASFPHSAWTCICSVANSFSREHESVVEPSPFSDQESWVIKWLDQNQRQNVLKMGQGSRAPSCLPKAHQKSKWVFKCLGCENIRCFFFKKKNRYIRAELGALRGSVSLDVQIWSPLPGTNH